MTLFRLSTLQTCGFRIPSRSAMSRAGIPVRNDSQILLSCSGEVIRSTPERAGLGGLIPSFLSRLHPMLVETPRSREIASRDLPCAARTWAKLTCSLVSSLAVFLKTGGFAVCHGLSPASLRRTHVTWYDSPIRAAIDLKDKPSETKMRAKAICCDVRNRAFVLRFVMLTISLTRCCRSRLGSVRALAGAFASMGL